jgi:hypothetical protein
VKGLNINILEWLKIIFLFYNYNKLSDNVSGDSFN